MGIGGFDRETLFKSFESQRMIDPRNKKTCLTASLTCTVAGCTGLEPATSDVTGRRSNQLS